MRKAFSLVELSIVLVILGLLVGGILAGQSLIRASELRKVSNDIQRYRTATHAFRDKYFSFPGDMANATAFWGTAVACPGTNLQGSTDSKTCNGDGNGLADRDSNAPYGNEPFRFWQHLANAGLLEGSFSGVRGPNNSIEAVIGNNVPPLAMNNAGISAYHLACGYSSSNAFPACYENLFYLGTSYANLPTMGPFLTPQDAWNIDTKTDDGLPAYGKLLTWKKSSIYAPDCASGNLVTAQYDLTETNIRCALIAIGL